MNRWTAAVVVALGAVVANASVTLLHSGGAGHTTSPAPRATGGGMLLSVHERPSHGEIYRARAIPDLDGMRAGRAHPWQIEVSTADGRPVDDADLVLESWMPVTGRRAPVQPWVAEVLPGSYRVEGLQFDRPGWWNVSLVISGSAGVDSLAFNLIL
jgi:hypothetical protein